MPAVMSLLNAPSRDLRELPHLSLPQGAYEHMSAFVDAAKDPDVQRIAWEAHGFRSGLMGATNDPSVLQVTGLPAQVTQVTDLPAAATMERILDGIR